MIGAECRHRRQKVRGRSKKSFVGGRVDIYEGTGTFADDLRVMYLNPNTLAILQTYGIRSCIARNLDMQLATLLAATPGWKRVYQDKLSVLFVRQGQLHGGGS
jgi:hypothetical protein